MPQARILDCGTRVWVLIILIVLVGFTAYLMTPEERTRALVKLRAAAKRFPETARGGPATEPFAKAIADRTPWPWVAPAIALACVFVFLRIALASGSGDEALIAWGGNIGPRTTNWEWLRLIRASFVHSSLFGLLLNLAGLAAFGIIAERLIGSIAFATVCVTAALAASLVSVYLNPLGLSFGISGAVLGVYGFLLVAACRIFLKLRDWLVPLEIAKPLAPVAGVFLLYALVSGSLPVKAEFAALLAGAVCGFVLSKGIDKGKPSVKLTGKVFATAAVLAVVCAVPLAGLDDGRSELAAMAALEEKIAKQYDAEVDQRAGKSSADRLIRMIEATIVPELQAAERRLDLLDKVPDDQRPSIEHADRYLEERNKSWRLRVDGLRQRSILEARQSGRARTASGTPRPAELLNSARISLEKAEAAEREALEDLRAAVAILQ